MIRLRNVNKSFWLKGHRKVVAQNLNATFPTGASVALFGRNGAGKSTLLKMIGGSLNPSSGRIESTGTISFPVGFSGSFHPDLSGKQNARFVGRIYGVDTDALCEFVEDFAELGPHFDLPVRSYSSGMRSRLAFGVSMAIAFDTYLIDEVTSVGDATFRARCQAVLGERMQHAGVVMVSHSMTLCRNICSAGAVLESGKLTYYEDIDEAIAQHQANMQAPPPH